MKLILAVVVIAVSFFCAIHYGSSASIAVLYDQPLDPENKNVLILYELERDDDNNLLGYEDLGNGANAGPANIYSDSKYLLGADYSNDDYVEPPAHPRFFLQNSNDGNSSVENRILLHTFYDLRKRLDVCAKQLQRRRAANRSG